MIFKSSTVALAVSLFLLGHSTVLGLPASNVAGLDYRSSDLPINQQATVACENLNVECPNAGTAVCDERGVLYCQWAGGFIASAMGSCCRDGEKWVPSRLWTGEEWMEFNNGKIPS
jgi:hypothetical protein